jgi:hypothetical protein
MTIGIKGRNSGFPKLKKGFDNSFRFPQGVKIEENRVFLPKGKIKNTTVMRESKKYKPILVFHRKITIIWCKNRIKGYCIP